MAPQEGLSQEGAALPERPAAAVAIAPPGVGAPALAVAAAVAPAAVAPIRERKLATVLFADIVGFTGYAEHADPEAVATTVAAAMERLAGIVVEHGGTVDKYLGDALMAVFGVPTAHDDDAERAVAAALAMRDSGGDLTLRIGVNSGEVLATAMPGDDHVTVIGDTVNVADRLTKAGSPGEVLIGPLTAELCSRRVLLRPREAVLVKGRTEAVPHFEAVGLRGADDASEGADGAGELPLVGREDEIAFLCGRWRRCVTQRRATPLVLVGEVGSGKSRLLNELARRVEGEARVVSVTYPAYGSLAGSRIVGAVVDQLGGPVGDPMLDARLASLGGDVVPELTGLDPASLEAEQLRAMRQVIEMRAAEMPLLMAIDEAQRLSETTHRFLAELMARVQGPVLLVLAGRPDPPDWLVRHPLTERLRIDPLGPEAAAELVSALLPDVQLDEESRTQLARRAAGNPLHLRELVRLVADRHGLVADASGMARLRGDLRLPPSLQAVLAARLDALEPAHKTTLQHASVTEGAPCTAAMLGALGVSDPEQSVDALVTAGVLRQLPGGGHEFADPLLREVAYESLPRHRRSQLHRRAAELSERVDERVRHLEAALAVAPDEPGLREEAAAALGDAGLSLMRRNRPVDAAPLLQRAVALGNREPRVLLDLAGRLADNMVGDTEVTAVLALLPDEGTDPAVDAERVHLMANALARSETARAIELYDQARRRWAAIGRRDKEAWALTNCAIAHILLGRFVEGGNALDEAIAIFDEAEERHGLSVARQTLGLVRPDDPRVEGWMDEGLRWALEAGDRSRERYARQSLAFYHFLRSSGGGLDDSATALEHARALAEVGADLGDHGACIQGHALAATILRNGGDLDGAVATTAIALQVEGDGSIGSEALRQELRDMVALLADPATAIEPPPLVESDAIALIAATQTAMSAALAGQIDLARALVDRAPGTQVDGVSLAVKGLVSGVALILGGDLDGALHPLTAARRTAEAQRAGPSAAAAAALLAETAARRGDAEGARAMLEGIPRPWPGGVAGLLMLRPAVALGDAESRRKLVEGAAALRAPGLLLGL